MSLEGNLVVLAAFAVMVTPMAAAQQQLERGPGFVGPGSPVYGLEVAMDNAAVDIGLAKASNVAQERAAEARKAAENGNWDAAQKAADNMASVAKKAKSGEVQGLQKAESVLQEVMKNAPPEAQQGLQTALDNLGKERGRLGGAPPEAPAGTPDKTPEQRMSEARTLMEQGRQDLKDGKDAMDNGDFQAAKTEFGQASQSFQRAIELVKDLDTPEAADLEQRLRDAKTSAEDARSQAQQQIDQQQSGNNTNTATGGAP